MTQIVIENPIINSPFDEPTRHFRFTDEGITNEIVDDRRISSYFVPIARPKKKGGQKSLFETEWTQDRIEENRFVNDIRRRVGLWRQGGEAGARPADRSSRAAALEGNGPVRAHPEDQGGLGAPRALLGAHDLDVLRARLVQRRRAVQRRGPVRGRAGYTPRSCALSGLPPNATAEGVMPEPPTCHPGLQNVDEGMVL